MAKKANPGASWLDLGQSAVNGVIGDLLHRRGNDLEIEMQLLQNHTPIVLTAEKVGMLSQPTAKVCLLVHGLCANESIWTYRDDSGDDFGRSLQRDCGFTPLYTRYNSGLHISQNGEALADQLQKLVSLYRPQVEELLLIGHSMGGLVLRSACHYAEQKQQEWLPLVKKVFFIGTPHLGAPLEKLANVVSNALSFVHEPYTQLAEQIINLRSDGIKDLRHANIAEEQWRDKDIDALDLQGAQTIPLVQGIEHFVIGGSLSPNPKQLVNKIFGDALVLIDSSLGRDKKKGGLFPRDHLRLFAGIGHNSLARSPAVYDQIKTWYLQDWTEEDKKS